MTNKMSFCKKYLCLPLVIFLLSLSLGCSKATIGFLLYGKFNDDKIVIRYDNNTLIDTTLTSLDTIKYVDGRIFEGRLGRKLVVNVNSGVSNSVYVTKEFNRIKILMIGDSIIFSKIRKTIRY